MQAEAPTTCLRGAGADTADANRYVLVGAPRTLVLIGKYCVDLAIYERLIESGSWSCLMRTMIECFTTQDHHVTVDTIQARLATMAKPELYRFSAVADQETLKIVQGHVVVSVRECGQKWRRL